MTIPLRPPHTITLPDGTRVAFANMKTGPLTDAACSKCNRLAGMITVREDGQRFCQECAPAKVGN